jgi:hypothetical protein
MVRLIPALKSMVYLILAYLGRCGDGSDGARLQNSWMANICGVNILDFRFWCHLNMYPAVNVYIVLHVRLPCAHIDVAKPPFVNPVFRKTHRVEPTFLWYVYPSDPRHWSPTLVMSHVGKGHLWPMTYDYLIPRDKHNSKLTTTSLIMDNHGMWKSSQSFTLFTGLTPVVFAMFSLSHSDSYPRRVN